MTTCKIRKEIRFTIHASLAAFGTYFCMYAFRKPFTAGTFESFSFLGIDYKILLIISQVLGYALSKILGIRFISELKSAERLPYLFVFILIAEVALLLFAYVPQPYNIIFLFLNGLPLGMIWGIVFSFLEGRKVTDILGVVLSSSFIVSSGVVKSAGLFVMNNWGVNEFLMPAVTGALFLVPFFVFAWFLGKIPPPTAEDKKLRVERVPMTRNDRKTLVRNYLFALIILVFFYTLLTAFRDFRDNFARELWDSIGYKGDISVFSFSEIMVAIVVLFILGSLFYIKNNLKALFTYHILLIIGTFLTGVSTFLFQIQVLNPFLWMVCTGFGLYICYVPFNCLFFDRFIAAFRIKGNSGFLIYIADSFGYLGSILVLLYKNFAQPALSWLNFFIYGSYVMAIVGILISLISMLHLRKKYIKTTFSKNLHYGTKV
ncbi:DUF5690 family protein [Ascidiimonas aurantiaca]|uniref:DUF5690 family protein n=1 Tax=Ascidiimonas aurantiaca TaxID=1685432 RepID=UPI0030EC0300